MTDPNPTPAPAPADPIQQNFSMVTMAALMLDPTFQTRLQAYIAAGCPDLGELVHKSRALLRLDGSESPEELDSWAQLVPLLSDGEGKLNADAVISVVSDVLTYRQMQPVFEQLGPVLVSLAQLHAQPAQPVAAPTTSSATPASTAAVQPIQPIAPAATALPAPPAPAPAAPTAPVPTTFPSMVATPPPACPLGGTPPQQPQQAAPTVPPTAAPAPPVVPAAPSVSRIRTGKSKAVVGFVKGLANPQPPGAMPPAP